VSGHTDEGKPQRKGTASDATGGIGADDCIGYDGYNGELTGGKASTLGVNCGISTGRNGVITFEPGIASREGGHIYEGVSGTLRANAGDNQMATAYTLKIRSGCEGGGKGALVQTDKSATLATNNDQYLFQPVYSVENHPNDSRVGINEDGIVQALTSRMGTGGGNVPMVLALDRAAYNQGKNAQYDFEISDKGVNSPLVAKGPGAVCYSVDQGGGKSACNVTEGQAPTLTCTHGGEPVVCYEQPKIRYMVRRLTPLECERLQGYPDGWTDIGEWTDSNGKKRQTSDAARYKALGNSIALPPWKWVLKRLCACYERDATMASLFDGIGGFPYLWEQLNGKGTCLWASEIEEFPIAVTKVRLIESGLFDYKKGDTNGCIH
jgi:DNA (cytosine-5)-methyltransferase 1